MRGLQSQGREEESLVKLVPRAAVIAAIAVLCALPGVRGDIIANYTVDHGGTNPDPLNGLAARATFSLNGTQLTILLENVSTGEPPGFQAADSLLVSLGLNLPVDIASGDASVIGPGSVGLGSWSGLVASDSVADQWIWTNSYGGDLMSTFRNIISTSQGQGGGPLVHFDGGSGNVDGPFGGIAANPPLLQIPNDHPAVSNSIRFDLTLAGTLTDAQLQTAADAGIVEFGSDARYLGTPEPASALLLGVAVVLLRRR